MKEEYAGIVWRVAHFYGVPPEEVVGRKRTRTVSRARAVAMYLMRRRSGYSYPELGRVFGRDHTTVLAAVNKVAALLKTDGRVADIVAELEGE